MSLLILLVIVAALFNHSSCRPEDNHIFIERAPYMASLRLNGTYHWCSASIIHEQFVLTAAHCIEPNQNYQVLVGTEEGSGKEGELFDIEEISIHDSFNNTIVADVCLIKLKKPLTFGKKIGKISLAGTDLVIQKGTEFNSTAWVFTKKNDVYPKLLQLEVPVIDSESCNKTAKYLLGIYLTSYMMCAEEFTYGSYHGDDGSPLTLGDQLVGVASFDVGDGEVAAVYTKVSAIQCWIKGKIN